MPMRESQINFPAIEEADDNRTAVEAAKGIMKHKM